MGWNAKYAILIAASTVMTYAGSLIIEKINASLVDDEKKKTLYKKVTL